MKMTINLINKELVELREAAASLPENSDARNILDTISNAYDEGVAMYEIDTDINSTRPVPVDFDYDEILMTAFVNDPSCPLSEKVKKTIVLRMQSQDRIEAREPICVRMQLEPSDFAEIKEYVDANYASDSSLRATFNVIYKGIERAMQSLRPGEDIKTASTTPVRFALDEISLREFVENPDCPLNVIEDFACFYKKDIMKSIADMQFYEDCKDYFRI